MSEAATYTPKTPCPGRRKDGYPCKANVTSSGWCPWHDPGRTEAEKIGWARKGALASVTLRGATQPDAPDPIWANPEDVQRAIKETYGAVTRGDVSSDIAGVRLRACDSWMKVWEALNLRSQLESLEQLIGQKLERRWG